MENCIKVVSNVVVMHDQIKNCVSFNDINYIVGVIQVEKSGEEDLALILIEEIV